MTREDCLMVAAAMIQVAINIKRLPADSTEEELIQLTSTILKEIFEEKFDDIKSIIDECIIQTQTETETDADTNETTDESEPTDSQPNPSQSKTTKKNKKEIEEKQGKKNSWRANRLKS